MVSAKTALWAALDPQATGAVSRGRLHAVPDGTDHTLCGLPAEVLDRPWPGASSEAPICTTCLRLSLARPVTDLRDAGDTEATRRATGC